MTDNYGPGMGSIIGLRIAQVRNEADAQVSELDALRARLRRAEVMTFYDQAFALAAADIVASVLAELGGAQPRILSVASAREVRNAKGVQLAAEHVRKLSNGRVNLSRADMQRIAAMRPLR